MSGHALTWDDLTTLELGLADLERVVRSIHDDPATEWFCANDHWYGYGTLPGIKSTLSRLVGDEARKPGAIIRSSETYDLAYEHLYDLLPSCRGACGCL